MNSNLTYLENIEKALKTRGLYRRYAKCVLTPEYVRDIITETNHGNIEKAFMKIQQAKSVLSELRHELPPEVVDWYCEIIMSLEASVGSWCPN